MNTRAVTLSEDIRPDKEYVRWLRDPGMAEQHDGRVTDKQPALTLLHKAGYAGCPEASAAFPSRTLQGHMSRKAAGKPFAGCSKPRD